MSEREFSDEEAATAYLAATGSLAIFDDEFGAGRAILRERARADAAEAAKDALVRLVGEMRDELLLGKSHGLSDRVYDLCSEALRKAEGKP